MAYPLHSLIEPALVVGPADDVLGLPGGVYVVVHRRFGTFTHVYRAERCRRTGRTEVHLLRVLTGARLAEARAWVRARLPAVAAVSPLAATPFLQAAE
ncbi:hypothetical protein [Caenispirillum bisanense]|uniref:Uncharacterized protein n=1 Tax=Caenispirillum bisanense TaxID=414052 RepID=A0A286H0X0_9PROT|nr:hypothetical protein [Caenispirillum bisanense]SOE01391.1 hypothetical protein SAMN05421508_11815 [Caenispirillum bisanense]